MKNLFRIYLLSFFLLSDIVLFAQPDGGGGVEDEDPAPAPINSKLILLAIMGILFVFYTFRKNKKTI
ncbi:hypothetical protein [Flavobacterium macrobrachii]|jgi:hypothetical protein|uniref:hypothetical protein n=1 Tax=Flavobacterium macrobrachii TaxID=591204 RepID=UPI0037BF9DB8